MPEKSQQAWLRYRIVQFSARLQNLEDMIEDPEATLEAYLYDILTEIRCDARNLTMKTFTYLNRRIKVFSYLWLGIEEGNRALKTWRTNTGGIPPIYMRTFNLVPLIHRSTSVQ